MARMRSVNSGLAVTALDGIAVVIALVTVVSCAISTKNVVTTFSVTV